MNSLTTILRFISGIVHHTGATIAFLIAASFDFLLACCFQGDLGLRHATRKTFDALHTPRHSAPSESLPSSDNPEGTDYPSPY